MSRELSLAEIFQLGYYWETKILLTAVRLDVFSVLDGKVAAEPFATYEALLAELLADPSESLKCVDAHHVAERHLVTLRHELTRLRPLVGPPLVIYAFDQAIARLDA